MSAKGQVFYCLYWVVNEWLEAIKLLTVKAFMIKLDVNFG